MTNTFVVDYNGQLPYEGVILTPRQATFIENLPAGARVVTPTSPTPWVLPPERPRKVMPPPIAGRLSPEEVLIKKLQDMGFKDIQVHGDIVTAKGKVPVTLQLSGDVSPSFFLNDAKLVSSQNGVQTWKGDSEGTVKFKIVKGKDEISLKPLSAETKAQRALEEYNARMEAHLDNKKIGSSNDASHTVTVPRSVVLAHMPEAMRPQPTPAAREPPRGGKALSLVVHFGTNPEVTAERMHRAMLLEAGPHVPDAFIPSTSELERKLGASAKKSPSTEEDVARKFGVTDEKTVISPNTAIFEAQPPKPSLLDRAWHSIEGVAKDFSHHFESSLSSGILTPTIAADETLTDLVDSATRITPADTPTSASLKGLGRALASIVTWPVDLTHWIEEKTGRRKPSTLYLPSDNKYVNAYLSLKMRGLEMDMAAGSAIGNLIVMGAPNVAYEWSLARFADKPPTYEVTYTLGRAKGQIYGPESSRVFDITAQQKELVHQLPKENLAKNMRISLDIRQVRTAEGLQYMFTAVKRDVAGSLRVPSESKFTLSTRMGTEMGIERGGYTAGTIRRPNYTPTEMRFSLADYGRTLGAKPTVRALSSKFGQPKMFVKTGETTPTVGHIELSVPIQYDHEDFLMHPLGEFAKELGTTPVTTDGEFEKLIQKALEKYGTKTITSIKEVSTPPTAKPPVAITFPKEAHVIKAKSRSSSKGSQVAKTVSKQEDIVTMRFEMPAVVDEQSYEVEPLARTLTVPPIIREREREFGVVEGARQQTTAQRQRPKVSYKLMLDRDALHLGRTLQKQVEQVQVRFGSPQRTRKERGLDMDFRVRTLPIPTQVGRTGSRASAKLKEKMEGLSIPLNKAPSPTPLHFPSTYKDMPGGARPLRFPSSRKKKGKGKGKTDVYGWEKKLPEVNFNFKFSLGKFKGWE